LFASRLQILILILKTKNYLYHAILALLTAVHTTAGEIKTNAWGPATNDVQMAIRLKGNPAQITTNEPVKLLICYRNVSTNRNFTIYRPHFIEHDPGCFFKVISPSGMDIPFERQFSQSGGPDPLAPNQTMEIDFNLSVICKFNEAGTYKIIARKAIYWPEKRQGFMVVSNPLDVTIVAHK